MYTIGLYPTAQELFRPNLQLENNFMWNNGNLLVGSGADQITISKMLNNVFVTAQGGGKLFDFQSCKLQDLSLDDSDNNAYYWNGEDSMIYCLKDQTQGLFSIKTIEEINALLNTDLHSIFADPYALLKSDMLNPNPEIQDLIRSKIQRVDHFQFALWSSLIP